MILDVSTLSKPKLSYSFYLELAEMVFQDIALDILQMGSLVLAKTDEEKELKALVLEGVTPMNIKMSSFFIDPNMDFSLGAFFSRYDFVKFLVTVNSKSYDPQALNEASSKELLSKTIELGLAMRFDDLMAAFELHKKEGIPVSLAVSIFGDKKPHKQAVEDCVREFPDHWKQSQIRIDEQLFRISQITGDDYEKVKVVGLR